MRIMVKLYASLSEYLPAEKCRGNAMPLEVPDGATIVDVIEPYSLPQKLLHLVLVNGRYVEPDERATRRLEPGDTLAIWPPVDKKK